MLPVKKHLEAPPSSTGEFRYLLGLVGYFRRHVANFDKIAKPYMTCPRSQISKVNSNHHLQQILEVVHQEALEKMIAAIPEHLF